MPSTTVPIIGAYYGCQLPPGFCRYNLVAASPFSAVGVSTYAVTNSIAAWHIMRTKNPKDKVKLARFKVAQPSASTLPGASCENGRHASLHAASPEMAPAQAFSHAPRGPPIATARSIPSGNAAAQGQNVPQFVELMTQPGR